MRSQRSRSRWSRAGCAGGSSTCRACRSTSEYASEPPPRSASLSTPRNSVYREPSSPNFYPSYAGQQIHRRWVPPRQRPGRNSIIIIVTSIITTRWADDPAIQAWPRDLVAHQNKPKLQEAPGSRPTTNFFAQFAPPVETM